MFLLGVSLRVKPFHYRLPITHPQQVTNWAVSRLRLLLVILPTVSAALLVPGARRLFCFSLGSWRKPAIPGVSWLRLMFIGALLFSVCAVATIALIGKGGAISSPLTLLPFLPGIIAFCLLNSTLEELIYRVALFAPLKATVGFPSALVVQALTFGLAHYSHGHPSGFGGAATGTLAGLLLGFSVKGTGGISWAIAWHALMDFWIVIFNIAPAVNF